MVINGCLEGRENTLRNPIAIVFALHAQHAEIPEVCILKFCM